LAYSRVLPRRAVYMLVCLQAEDGIRDYKVTGVQTCALPISGGVTDQPLRPRAAVMPDLPAAARIEGERFIHRRDVHHAVGDEGRSEERRVGKECRSRWAPET